MSDIEHMTRNPWLDTTGVAGAPNNNAGTFHRSEMAMKGGTAKDWGGYTDDTATMYSSKGHTVVTCIADGSAWRALQRFQTPALQQT